MSANDDRAKKTTNGDTRLHPKAEVVAEQVWTILPRCTVPAGTKAELTRIISDALWAEREALIRFIACEFVAPVRFTREELIEAIRARGKSK